jgi:hypothetical protein
VLSLVLGSPSWKDDGITGNLTPPQASDLLTTLASQDQQPNNVAELPIVQAVPELC